MPVTTVLLIIIYLAFIGLGIPDAIFGAAWPAVANQFQIPVSYANFVTIIISTGTIVSSLISARLINRFGPGIVTAVSTSMTAFALLGFSISGNMVSLCLFAVPLGVGAGTIDAALNNYVALHYKASHMNFIACFYGIGITISPFLMSFALKEQNNWHMGYRTVFYLQSAVALVTILSVPLWKKPPHSLHRQEREPVPCTIPFLKLAKMPPVCLSWMVFFSSCAIEFTCNVWGSTFLVQEKQMTTNHAAQLITFYYIGMTLGRFGAGLLCTQITSWRIIHIGQWIISPAIVLLFLPLPAPFSAVALFFIGVGNGPIFPNLTYLTPQNFGKDLSQSVMGTQMAAASTGILVMPVFFGWLAQILGLWLFPFYLFTLFLCMALSSIFLIRHLKQQKRYCN